MSIKDIFDKMEYGPAPETAELALTWIKEHKNSFGIFVGGKWSDCKTKFDSFNPATGKSLAKISQAESTDVDTAVKAARKAFGSWSNLSGYERAKYLYSIGRQIQKRSRLIAVVESLDNGKPIRESRDLDIPLAARHFIYHAGWASQIDVFDGYEPARVCGQIIPWNFPLLMLAWKIAPALAAGNTIVLKPAEFTSLSALLFAEICEEIGLPPGVVNIVTGDAETGKAIVNHPDIDKLAFTGSTEVGRILRTATAGTHKKLSLELGGKSPFIVFDDADLDGAVEGVVDAIWFNQGQVCCAGSRLLIQESVAPKFIEKLKLRMENLRVGDPLDKAIDIGAIIAPVQLQQITDLVQTGVNEGAEIYQPNCKCPASGWFYPPTLLTGVQPASTVAQVEIFGPVLVSMTFRTPEEAIALANNTPYGLAASVWTENMNKALDIASHVKAGTVWVNCTNQFDAASGFGGYKESGYGREGGREGMFEYLKLKTTASKPQKKTQLVATAKQIDRTHKLYIGGKHVRPDGGNCLVYQTKSGHVEVARGNRKDIRNAVEAAESVAKSWATTTAYNRAQILYYLAENLDASRQSFIDEQEFDACLELCFAYAGWADKFDGQVHQVPMRGMTFTRNEPLSPIGLVCPDSPSLLGFLSMVLPCISQGNTVIAIPSQTNPIPVCELMHVIQTSDIPAGVLNIVTGSAEELVPTLADHEAVQSIWNFRSDATHADIQKRSTGNLKQTWCLDSSKVDITKLPREEFLRRATQVKNIWVPYGS